jgi:hypothetical protein
MSCERLNKCWLIILLLLAACRRETPAITDTHVPATDPSAISTAAGPRPDATYDDAVTWFRSTPAGSAT